MAVNKLLASVFTNQVIKTGERNATGNDTCVSPPLHVVDVTELVDCFSWRLQGRVRVGRMDSQVGNVQEQRSGSIVTGYDAAGLCVKQSGRVLSLRIPID